MRQISRDVSPNMPTGWLWRNRRICLQHAHNPVDWFAWGDEAFARARAEGKPIFLSVGYSTCHWCHVMERESFEDERVGAFLNEHFVSIKLDREERPDVDKIYMTFVQSTTGSGGWPMNVFLTPDLKPFYGGTYFPPDNRHGRPGFLHLLQQINRLWQERKSDIATSADEIHARLESALAVSAGSNLAVDGGCFEKRSGGFQVQLRSGSWRIRRRAEISAAGCSVAASALRETASR